MTIDEKIKQAADKYKRMLVPQDGYMTQRCFIAGADFLKSEMLADMQKLADALEFYQKHADCNSGVIYGNCRCSFCKRDEEFKRTFSEFNAKYKE